MTSQTSKITYLRRLVAIMTSVVGLAVVVLTFLQVEWDRRESLRQHVADMENLSAALTRQAESTIRDAHAVLLGMQRKLQVSGYGPESLNEVLEVARAQSAILTDVQGFTVLDANGRPLVTTVRNPITSYSALDREYFLVHRNNQVSGLYIGPPVKSRMSGEWVISLSMRLSDASGEFHGVVMATLLVQHFVDFYQTIDLGSQGVIGMAKRDGTLLVRSKDSDQHAGLNMSSSPLLRKVNEEGVTRGSLVLTAMIDGVRRIYGFDTSDEYPILVAASLGEEEAMAAWRSRSLQNWSLAACVLVILFSMGWLIWRALGRQGRMEARLQSMHRDLALANHALEIMAGEDALTGLANRRRLDEALRAAFQSAAAQGQPLSFVLLDVDHFKRFNDQYGHPAGDEALKQVAAVLKRHAKRNADTTARYGGEELALILPGAESTAAMAVAERIRADVEALAIANQGSPYANLTLSIGVASCTPGQAIQTPADLVAAADVALYAAKSAGRNRVNLAAQPV
ncbi:sensor domain-containing diguanylate cyclase [Pseudomonas straminea]|uniref:diguanylate cyclase n=2 Tax=Pseudomonas straminea TaxID=47882 RepID=A0A1I1RA22_PSEOC|nr:sensor domain-containing diguanylate cyclase [Pseudomonas straminea]SFD31201.1 diguanylate cyclase (GGDEF) domain-containing protein [Pseudomonas straminea]